MLSRSITKFIIVIVDDKTYLYNPFPEVKNSKNSCILAAGRMFSGADEWSCCGAVASGNLFCSSKRAMVSRRESTGVDGRDLGEDEAQTPFCVTDDMYMICI